MKKILFLSAVCAVMALQGAGAQMRITGRCIAAEADTAVGYVTVAAMRDSTCVAANCADGNGRFSLTVDKAATYSVTFSMLGYRTVVREVDIEGDTDMGDIRMEEGEQLESVEIVVQKPLVTHTAEKLSYEVENDPQAATATLDEILRKVPQLSIDAEGKVLVNGESNYKILVNGHSQGSMSRNFNEIIKSMPASSIKRIEVITNPGIKYDAEGTSGILNIITSSRRIDGFDGSLSDRLTFYPNTYNNVNGRVAFQSGKFALEVNAYHGYYNSPNNSSMQTLTENLVSETNRYQYLTLEHSWRQINYGGSLSASYQITDSDLLTLEGYVYASPGSKNKSLQHNTISDAEHNPVQEFTCANDSRFKYVGGSATLAYEHRFDEEGDHTLSFADNLDIDPDWWTNRNIYTGDIDYTQIDKEDTRTIENTFQADYSIVMGEKHTVDVGAKHVFRRSSIDSRSDIDDVLQQSETMRYTQNVAALYGGYGYSGDAWSVNGGVRIEATYNKATVTPWQEAEYSFDNSFWNVVPYLSVGWQPSTGHNLSLTYTERLGRPSIEQLSPYQTVSPLSISSGNPDLSSEVSHSFTLKYAYSHNKWNLSVAPMAYISNNGIAFFSRMLENGITYSMPTNDMRSRRYSLMATLMFRPNDKFSLSFSSRVTYGRYRLPQQGIDTSGTGFNESLSMDIKLWKGATLDIYESVYRSSVYLAMTSNQWTWYYGLGINQKLFDDKLTLSISANNPFRDYITNTSVRQTPTYISWRESRYRASNISFGISWRFGKRRADVKSISKSIDNDDSISSGDSGSSK